MSKSQRLVEEDYDLDSLEDPILGPGAPKSFVIDNRGF